MHFGIAEKPTTASSLKYPKYSHRKCWKLPFSTTPLSFDAPSRRISANIRISLIPPETIESLAYISMGLSSFKFLWWALKDAPFPQQSAYRPFKVIPSKVVDFGTDRKGVCDLVVNSNFGPILHHFWDKATYWLKMGFFPTPLSFNALARGEPFRISEWIFYPEN